MNGMEIYLFSIMSVDFDIWKLENPQNELENFAKKKEYEAPNRISDTLFEIKVGEKERLFVCKYGVLIYLQKFDEGFGEDASEILIWKDKISDAYIKEKKEPRKWLEAYCGFFEGRRDDCAGICRTTVHYTLICYAPKSKNFNDKALQEQCLWLISKSKPEEKEICDKIEDTMKKFGATSVIMDEKNVLFSAWGARIILSDNEEFIQDYIRLEVYNQSLWLLISEMNKHMDVYISKSKSRSEQIFEITDKVYDVMFYQAEFNYVNAKTTHRYQLEIQKKLYEVSNLDTMSNYFKEKMDILEKKVKMMLEKEERNSSERLNLILNILTIVSSISAIFQIVDYWINAPQNICTSLVTSVIVSITLIVIFVIKYFFQKRNRR